MKKHLIFFLFIIPFLALSSCSGKRTCEDIFKTVHNKEKGFKQEWQLQNGKTISCTFLPTSYQICQQQQTGASGNLATKNELEEEITFLLEFPLSEYSKSEQYFMFDLEKNLHLEQNHLQIEPLYCFLEQSYGISGYQKIFTSFNKQQVDISAPFKIALKHYLNEAIDIRFDFLIKDLQI